MNSLSLTAKGGTDYETPVYVLHKQASEGRVEIERTFTAAGLGDRLMWLAPGHATKISVDGWTGGPVDR